MFKFMLAYNTLHCVYINITWPVRAFKDISTVN